MFLQWYICLKEFYAEAFLVQPDRTTRGRKMEIISFVPFNKNLNFVCQGLYLVG